MTPKEKAEELVERMTVHHWTDVCDFEGAKQCALIAVNELIEATETVWFLDGNYWEEVKQEIINI